MGVVRIPTEVLVGIVIVPSLAFGVAALFLAIDDDTWEQTEDPACYLHVHHYNHLFFGDSVTRVRYCEVAS